MGNCGTHLTPYDVKCAENMARVCGMRSKILGQKQAEIMIKDTQSMQDQRQLTNLAQQQHRLIQMQLTFDNVSNINQTQNTLKAISGAFTASGVNDTSVDEVLDIQDALAETNAAFAEIDSALFETTTDSFPPPKCPPIKNNRVTRLEKAPKVPTHNPIPRREYSSSRQLVAS